LAICLPQNVYIASSSQFENPAIVKYARFDWEIGYYAAETRAYSWIESQHIGPAFLGHLTEEGRIIGFVLERVEGRHATISDLHACESLVTKMHGLGILHGDLNKYNFLITGKCAVLVDFETAQQSQDKKAIQKELEGLKQQLLDESGKGGVASEDEEIEGQGFSDVKYKYSRAGLNVCWFNCRRKKGPALFWEKEWGDS
jgi:predicted Ser/Thr protein kinase